ncbi:MAG: hypothetical protein QOJ58_5682 [Alphaproteobacteria bacterium]|nr:hypothetical protein [Alphaproteobacteria bacterium]
MSRLVGVPGKVAQARGTIAHPLTMQNCEDEITHGGHGVRGGAASNAAGVLTKGDVSHVMHLILNRPVPATQAEQVRGSGPLRRQAGDPVMHLSVPVCLSLSLMDESTNLRQTRPGDPFSLQSSSRVECPNVDPTMAAINRSRALPRLERRRERIAAAPAAALADCP